MVLRKYNNINCSGCKVHAGFYEAANNIKANVTSEVAKLSKAKGILNVKTTGHSLGGALANLLAAELS